MQLDMNSQRKQPIIKIWRQLYDFKILHREERSSQLVHNLSSCEREVRKQFKLERDTNP